MLPKDTFGQALTYLRSQFDPLLIYLDDGRMPIDNNETEQLMKQVAIGRKNWLFIGDVEPGYRAARADAKATKRARRRVARKEPQIATPKASLPAVRGWLCCAHTQEVQARVRRSAGLDH